MKLASWCPVFKTGSVFGRQTDFHSIFKGKSSDECDSRILSESAALSFLPFPHDGSVNQTISDYGNFSSASPTISYYSILLNGVISEELHCLRLISWSLPCELLMFL